MLEDGSGSGGFFCWSITAATKVKMRTDLSHLNEFSGLKGGGVFRNVEGRKQRPSRWINKLPKLFKTPLCVRSEIIYLLTSLQTYREVVHALLSWLMFLADWLRHPVLPGQNAHTPAISLMCWEVRGRAEEETWASAVVTGSTLVRSICSACRDTGEWERDSHSHTFKLTDTGKRTTAGYSAWKLMLFNAMLCFARKLSSATCQCFRKWRFREWRYSHFPLLHVGLTAHLSRSKLVQQSRWSANNIHLQLYLTAMLTWGFCTCIVVIVISMSLFLAFYITFMKTDDELAWCCLPL